MKSPDVERSRFIFVCVHSVQSSQQYMLSHHFLGLKVVGFFTECVNMGLVEEGAHRDVFICLLFEYIDKKQNWFPSTSS